jgi:hypothetical protein
MLVFVFQSWVGLDGPDRDAARAQFSPYRLNPAAEQAVWWLNASFD